MGQPKILLLDIETLPNLVTSWGLKVNGWLPAENIVQERTIISAAWKWLDVPQVKSASVLSAPGSKEHPDRGILRKLHKVLNQADAVVGHYIDRFDMPWIKGRMFMQGMTPPKPVIQIDTCKLARQHFYLNSAKLDYLGKQLGVGNKIKTEYDLWKRCMLGDPEAIRQMVTYNEEDVRLLERVYLKMRPYVVAKLNRALFAQNEDDQDRTCPACQEVALRKMGHTYSRVQVRQNYQCQKCWHWSYRISKRTIPR